MKKNFLILIVTIFILTACNTPIKENKLKAKWTLDESLKPDITFTKSTDNDVNGIFYSEGQITYEEFRSYITTLEKNGFKLDWRYSDAETLDAIDKAKTKKAEPKKSTKVGRNDPCPCGSGKKYKNCCGK